MEEMCIRVMDHVGGSGLIVMTGFEGKLSKIEKNIVELVDYLFQKEGAHVADIFNLLKCYCVPRRKGTGGETIGIIAEEGVLSDRAVPTLTIRPNLLRPAA
ncbi:MAG: hypothetical protein P4M13_03915 [Alphaproteobacteria bacterium]|nr:hypothetical protein [Alphaproteobacteria bacterium]